jgi:hypothetical protein
VYRNVPNVSTAVIEGRTAPGRAASADVPPDGAARWTPVRRAQLAAVTVVTFAVCLQDPAEAFVADATIYWGGAMAIVEGGDVFAQGWLGLRGISTAFLYLPAAAVVALAGGSVAAFAVLVQNAVLIASIGAVLIPGVVGLWRPVTPAVVWTTAAGSALLLAGLATAPLSDLWAAALMLAAVVALKERSWRALLFAGVATGLAFNIRPAVLFAMLGIALAVCLVRRVRGLWFLGGVAFALVPQILANRWWDISWLPWPEETFVLTQVQARYASYTVRFDGVLGPDGLAPLFYCSPSMAGAIDGEAPGSGGDMVGLFVANLPQAIVFSAQKVGAALHWPLTMPYYTDAPGVNALFALTVTAGAVVGAAALLRSTVRQGWRSMGLARLVVLILWVSSVASLISAATENRFALSLVSLGIAGCGLLVADGVPDVRGRAGRIWVAVVALAVVAVFAVGTTGLQHPFSGIPAVADCAGM